MDTVGLSFAAAIAFAVIVERISEVLVDSLIPEEHKKWTIVPTAGLGILGAFAFGLDVIGPIMEQLGQKEVMAWVGQGLTGLAIGGGSNLVHDLWPGSRKRRERVEFYAGTLEKPGAAKK